jgi:hypothetical protein
VRVFERSATQTLRRWDGITARIVTVLGKTEFTGALLPSRVRSPRMRSHGSRGSGSFDTSRRPWHP